jgi:hypothetical protein
MFPVPTLGNRWTLCQASEQSVPDNLSLCPRSRACLALACATIAVASSWSWRRTLGGPLPNYPAACCNTRGTLFAISRVYS